MAGPKLGAILRVCRFGPAPQAYLPALGLQRRLAALREADAIPDTLLQLQHPLVYTAGKRAKELDFRVPLEDLRARGYDVHFVERGGEVTFHGPGQAVAYPIVKLRSTRVGARLFVEGLEDVMVRTLGIYGVAARGRVPGKTGVWVGDRKAGAIGVRISRGVSSHGMSLNVKTDLTHYNNIVPCGTPEKKMTSLAKETGLDVDHVAVEDHMARAFAAHFNYADVQYVSPDALEVA
ncbi:unnamed protein product [Ostreobium quekettii]|uniref:lipoyl(octanoyl) transferase n=1 Tax=Ostreobium quekettii TaxID=121088 RepID=A0A8S1J8J6_9CHLO|nr:unnamed protein product [Ostreobium quekettii]|eukprot:evm.model.scf_1663.2 EVM.evm.TU.scf_1663.2   scf_1663:4868-8074(+)